MNNYKKFTRILCKSRRIYVNFGWTFGIYTSGCNRKYWWSGCWI